MPWLIDIIKNIINLYPLDVILANLEQSIADFLMIGIISYKQSRGNKELLIDHLLKTTAQIYETQFLFQENILTLDKKLETYEQQILSQASQVQINVSQFFSKSKPSKQIFDQPKPIHKIKLIEVIQPIKPQPNKLLISSMIRPLCQICLENMDYSGMWPLGCGHIFHRECLQQYCLTQVQSQVFPIICPNDKCKKDMNFTDLQEVLDSQSLNKYNQYSFKQLVDSHTDEYAWCPTPDCPYVFLPDKEPYFICLVCQKEYCLACRCDFHHGMNCEQYRASLKQKEQKQLDDQFMNFVKGAKFKQCPNCKVWVEKTQGCNHMTCRCKYQFCYFCGGKYNQCECVKRINW